MNGAEEKTSEISSRGSSINHPQDGQNHAPTTPSNTGNNLALSALEEVRRRENAALIAAAATNPSMLSDLQLEVLQNQIHEQARSTSNSTANSAAFNASNGGLHSNTALIASVLEQQDRERAAMAALLASPSNVATGGAFLGLPPQQQSIVEGIAHRPQLFLSDASAQLQRQQLVASQLLAQQQQLPGALSGQQYLLPSNHNPAALALAQQQRQIFLGQQALSNDTPGASKLNKGQQQQLQKDQQQALLLASVGGDISSATKQQLPPLASGVASREEGVQSHHLGKLPFPEKLYYMLEHTEKNGQDHVVSFVANGTAVMIHDPQAFETDVMPLYFASSRMSSVQRQLNIYGFVRIQQGPWRGAYCHPNFQKNKKELLSKIQTKRKSSAAAKQGQDDAK